jgi:hypothetical protein
MFASLENSKYLYRKNETLQFSKIRNKIEQCRKKIHPSELPLVVLRLVPWFEPMGVADGAEEPEEPGLT